MSELDFEQNFTIILLDKLEKSLNNDYELMLKELLNEYKEYTLNFSEEEIIKYNEFIESLKVFVKMISAIDDLNDDIDVVTKKYLLNNKPESDFISNLISNKTGINFEEIGYKLSDEYVFYVYEKIKNFFKKFDKSILKIINDKNYLLNQDSTVIETIFKGILSDTTIMEVSSFDYNGLLNKIDINTLSLLLDRKIYSIVPFIEDNVFMLLSKDQIIDLIRNKDNSDFYSNEKKRYILNIVGLKELFEITDYFSYDKFYEVIGNIDDTMLDFIIKNKKYIGIQKCQSVLNNKEYVKKLIIARYHTIFNYLSLEMIDDEILDMIDKLCNEIIEFAHSDSNLAKLLLNNKIFLKFSQNVSDHKKLLNIVGENITREMILFCMLDGMTLDEDMSDKIKSFYNRTLDDIKYAIEKGYKCSSKTIELTKEEIMLFINNGQPEIINYIKISNISTIDLIKYAIKMGYKMDNDLLERLNTYSNEIIIDLFKYSIDNNYENFYNSLLFIEENIPKVNQELLKIFAHDATIVSFLKFRISDFNTFWSLTRYIDIKSMEDIKKYFNNVGISDNLYNEVLFIPKMLKNFMYSYNLYNHFQNEPVIQSYIKFSVNRYELNLKNKEEIYKYFNPSGPSKSLYDLALTTPNLFNIFLKDYDTIYKDDLSVLNYIKFKIKYGLILNNEEEIYKYFNSFGPSDIFYHDVLFKDKGSYLNILIDDFGMLDKYKDNEVLLFYIKFSKKFGSNIFEFINKDNVNEYFSDSGVTEKLKQYMKNNPDYTKEKILLLVHNDQIINNADDMFTSIFEYYIVDTCFHNNKSRYNYLLEKLGPNILFHLDEENTNKLIELNDYELSLIFDIVESCKYDIVPSNITYDNVIISLCDFVFKRKYNDIVNVVSNIRSDLIRMNENELEMFIEYNLLIKDIIKVINCDKLILMEALRDCINLNEDKLRVICREYLVKCEKNFLEQNKETILEQFGVKKVFDKKDALRKLGDYYKLIITYEEFKKYCQLFMDCSNYNNIENNTFIDNLKMTKEQFSKVLSITEEEFTLIKNSIFHNTKPDDLVKEKFRYLKMFLTAYINYKYEHENIDTLLNELNVKKVSVLKLEDIDIFEILRGLDIDIYLNTVCKDNDILNNLKSVFQNKFLGRIPKSIGNTLEREYQIKLPGGINNIGSFMTKYTQILKEEQKRIKNQGGICDKLSDVKLSFVNVISTLSAINSETREVRRLIGKSAYNDFIADPNRNSSHYSPDKRQNKLVLLLDYLYSLNKITIPSKDIVMSNKNNTKKINIIVGNRTNESNICHGERTGACMRVGGVGEGLFLKCLTDKNWFHIRFEDPNTHEYISRVSGFRNGNTVYLNQLRDSSDDSKYTNSDLQEFITIYAKTLIEETKNSKYPIENVFINTSYAMEKYNHEEYNGKVYKLGNDIKNDYNLDDVEDYQLRVSKDIWTDVSGSAILLATTDEGKKNKDGYANIKNGIKNTDVYDVVRDKIYGIYSDEDILSHMFIKCDKERLMEVINRVHGMKEKLIGKNYKYEIEDIVLDENEIIDGYASSDFYVYIDSNNEIHSDYIEYIRKNDEFIPYGQTDKAKEEMKKYMEILKNKYLKVKNVI